MNLFLLDYALCRTPAFPTTAKIDGYWSDLIDLINESSPSFYSLIVGQEKKEILGNSKFWFSLWKYFNRACFRATPFGRFAAISLMSLDDVSKVTIISQNILTETFWDWQEKDSFEVTQNSLNNSNQLCTINSTLYVCNKEMRYVRFEGNVFQLATIVTFPILDSLIDFCKHVVTKRTVEEFLSEKFRLKPGQAKFVIKNLVGNNFLLTNSHANITGPDYFKRIGIDYKPSNSYTISKRAVLKGGINRESVNVIPELVEYLHHNLPSPTNPDLKKFSSDFSKKFGETWVNLATAIDPEFGIGYGELENIASSFDLEDLFTTKSKPYSQYEHSPFNSFLLAGIVSGRDINLEDFQGDSLTIKSKHSLPNTTSAIVHFYDGKTVIESIGGVTATGLLGRFTLEDPAILEFTRNIVDIEKAANPDIIFFDVAYQAEKKVDNINRRGNIYDYEFPILSWSCSPNKLTIEDLLVTVREGEIFLWSKTHRKRVVPRVASAYNYNRSDLALYRFFCDLQHQGLISNLQLDLKNSYPGLNFYPRVMFRNAIVSAKCCLVPKRISERKATKKLEDLKLWLKDFGIDGRFLSGDGDQKLSFDPFCDEDLHAFLSYCYQNADKDIYITEALLDINNLVKDEHKQSYASQMILSLAHDQPIYGQRKWGKMPAIYETPSHSHLPGEEWIYSEIYCHPLRTNELLTINLNHFLKNVASKIDTWFFIRYNQSGPHIRLRVKLKNAEDWSNIVSGLAHCLRQDFNDGLISDIQFKTYRPELERYGEHRILKIEKIFERDSNFAIKLLNNITDDLDLCRIILDNLEMMLLNVFPDIDNAVGFSQTITHSFVMEFQLTNDNLKKVNRFYIDLIARPPQTSKIVNRLFKVYMKQLLLLVKTCEEGHEQTTLLADLIHMHINRLFKTEQRKNEALIYEMLNKNLKKRRALERRC